MTREEQQWLRTTLVHIQLGDASAADQQKLQQLLRSSKEARACYLDFNEVGYHLHTHPSNVQALERKPASISLTILPALVGAAIAACVTFLLLSPNTSSPDLPKSQTAQSTSAIAVLQSSMGAKFTSTGGNNYAFDEGLVEMEEGVAKLEFNHGTELILDGKCNFEIINDKHVLLRSGKVWAHCPPTAYGFTISTPDQVQIVDLGTEFGVQIDPSGKNVVHVYDGVVEIHTPGAEAHTLVAGKAALWKTSGTDFTLAQADENLFLSSVKLEQQRIAAYQEKLASEPSLLAHFDFSELSDPTNHAPRNTSNFGLSVSDSVVQTSGRYSGASAALFNKTSSYIALHSELELRSCTINAWVKVNALNNMFSSILNGDGWSPNTMHFQITENGAIETSLFGGDVRRTRPASIELHQWHMLTVSWDFDHQEARVYCDGKLLEAAQLYTPPSNIEPWSADSINLQHAVIGNWNPLNEEIHRDRSLKGSIDELLIFDRALEPVEVMNLYFEGKP